MLHEMDGNNAEDRQNIINDSIKKVVEEIMLHKQTQKIVLDYEHATIIEIKIETGKKNTN